MKEDNFENLENMSKENEASMYDELLEKMCQEHEAQSWIPSAHSLEKIDRMLNRKYSVECNRCDGEGYISRYRHIKGGNKFQMLGRGTFGAL